MPMPESADFDVAIVGGGIAGPAMACALAPTGWRVLLVERSSEALDTARGDHLQPQTCEWLAQWGVLDDMWALGAEKRLGSRYLLPKGELVLHATVDQLAIPHPYYLYLNHELLSAALLGGAARNPAFERWCPATARPVATPSGMGLQVETESGVRQVRARLIVAADGRASRLRRAADISADSYAYQNPMLTLFAPRTLADERNEVRAYFSPVGIISVIPRTGGGWKIGFPVPPAELPRWRRAGTAELGARLTEWVPELAGVEPSVCGVYPITSMNAEHWTKGNLVLIGDACNTLHPGRSQGMNVALRAVHRLTAMLITAKALESPERLQASLQAFEADLKPDMDQRLADNHQRGLEMDRLDAGEQDRMRRGLARVAADSSLLDAYCLKAAGY
jgi:2-polyprenyl-6-methoxyphenol hydroxylase-like FAD-dependent oxidoreductase